MAGHARRAELTRPRLITLVFERSLKGDWPTARSVVERGITVLRTGNVVVTLPAMIASSAWILAQLGELGEARERLRECQQLVEQQAAGGITAGASAIWHWLGRSCFLLGMVDEALILGKRLAESNRPNVAYGHHLLGALAAHPERFDAERGEAHYREALSLAAPRGMRPLVAHCHLGLATLYRRGDKREQPREHLTTATTMYREMDMRF